MTAQGEDILAWLETAIAEREDTARLATQGTWRTHDTYLDLGGHTATVLVGEWNDTRLLAWLPTMSHTPWDEARNVWNNASHIAANDPESVLRRCAADRKLLELHAPTQGFNVYGGSCTACSACGAAEEYPVWYPCPSVLALAEGYGWTEGER